jgi:signal transduction histidine kinase/CheY-like chemotaxis protein
MRSRAAVLALSVFAAVATPGLLWAHRAVQGEREEQRRTARQSAQAAALAVEDQLGGALAAAHALAAIVRQSGRVDDFPAVAAEMLRVYDGASALQLAPGGVITEVHPREGNEAAVGIDLFARGPAARWAERARALRTLVLEGPFPLAQGGGGLVGRYPIFRREDGEERFWGFAAVVIRLDRFLPRTSLDALDDAGYDWTLSAPGGAPFATSAGEPPREPVVVSVVLPGTEWVLAVAPEAGWGSRWPVRDGLIVLAVAAALGLLSHHVLRQPEVLARLVAERTAELEEARARVEQELLERRRAEAAQRAAEAQAREAQKLEAIGQLAGGVAHDFNNLLVGILGYADLLAEPDPPVAEAADGIRQAARRAAELTRQLLGLARRGKFTSAPVDVAELVREVARLLERTVDKRIALDVHAGRGPAVALGDPGQLHQVILNLAMNARDAMPEGGVLTLETTRVDLGVEACRALPGLAPGPHVRLRVVDTGTGIPETVRGRIFEPFFTTKGLGKGTGLGLAVVHGIVRNHAGAIAFEPRPGGGTCFTLHLPAHDGALLAPGASRSEAEPPRGGSVLVVDDEGVVRDAALKMLERIGYASASASGADEALRLLDAGLEVDVALVDLVMPGRDGVECLAAMRRVRPGLAAVLSSGFAEDERVQRALDAGFTTFLYKPYGVEELSAAVRKALAAGGAPLERPA